MSARIAAARGAQLSRAAQARKRRLPAPWDLPQRWTIVRGDLVAVLAGKDKGRQGIVLKVHRDKGRVLVEGLNTVKRHVGPIGDQPGGIVPKSMPIHSSNIALVDPSDGRPCRVARRFLDDGTKVRISKRTGHVIARPDSLLQRKTPLPVVVGPKMTDGEVAHKKTFEISVAPADRRRRDSESLQIELGLFGKRPKAPRKRIQPRKKTKSDDDILKKVLK